jgi:hypothetical protein
LSKEILTLSDLKKLPKCKWDWADMPCANPNKVSDEECIRCTMRGVFDALLKENLAGVMHCLDALALMLAKKGII